ncbi:MAG TPA: hypothetical protein GXZ82_12945 [Firmicutes bacterium]|nr:hypothetical protein [Bacillota bacterium]
MRLVNRPVIVAILLVLLLGASAPCVAGVSEGAIVRIGKAFSIPAGDEHVGSIYVFGGNVDVAGVLRGRVVAVGGTLKISGNIEGDIIALGGRVTLIDGASIVGNVLAAGGGVHRDANVSLRGELNSINLSQGLHVPQFYWLPYNVKSFPIYSLYLLGLYIMAVIISLVFKEQAATIETALAAYPTRSLFFGLLALLLLVPVTVLLALSVVGMPLAYLIWLCFLIAKLMGYVVVADATGKYIFGHLGKRTPQLLHLALGIIVLGALRAIPYIGFVFGWLVLMVGVGSVVISRFGSGKAWWPFGRKKQVNDLNES